MRAKIKFNYACEMEISEEEAKLYEDKFNDDYISGLTWDINKKFLFGDLRTEAGGVFDFTYEVEE